MALPLKWIMFAVLLALTFWYVAPYLGVTGGLLHVLALGVMISLGLDLLGFKIFSLPIPIPSGYKAILTIGIFIFLTVSYSWHTGLFPASGVATSFGGPCVVTEELRGKTATLDVNAWDMESNTPYSAPIDVNPTYTYRSASIAGATALDYVAVDTDTSDASIGEVHVGDVVSLGGGSATYYLDRQEGICIDSQREAVNLAGRTAVAETELTWVVYDDTGATALDATASANYGDYNLTIGANEEKAIYGKLKVNVANNAYRLCAFGIATFYNITSVVPQGLIGSYSKVATPVHMQSIAIEVNTTTNSLTEDYVTYRLAEPVLMREWDSVKEQFVVTSDATNDPVDRQIITTPTDMNGFAVLAKDCLDSKGEDGLLHDDFYAHTTAEADVGVAETETSPRGKAVGFQVCAL